MKVVLWSSDEFRANMSKKRKSYRDRRYLNETWEAKAYLCFIKRCNYIVFAMGLWKRKFSLKMVSDIISVSKS